MASDAGAAPTTARRTRVGYVGGLDQHVLGQRQDHRPRTARRRRGEGAVHELGNPGRLVDLGDPLRHAAEHPAVVDLLERVALAAAAVDLADEQDHRQAVLLGDMHAGTGVGGTRATRHHRDAGPAGELAPRCGHHRGAALLAADHEADLGRVVQGIEDLEIALAGHAEDGRDAECRQLVDQDAPARPHVRSAPPAVSGGSGTPGLRPPRGSAGSSHACAGRPKGAGRG